MEVSVLKQRDEGATLIKVYVSPDEHQQLKALCADKGGMSHVLRMLAIKWISEQDAIAQTENTQT
ncbi:hypothetical protein [Calothrix sp. UHCC 0171]|uniref:hypothetical protein n=1 Tax=Calothrix sp. UHCC 0171 TaxID=3110245 RepID=UPI002B1F6842|nr:hypothetical protein [Calothrix sp. UHCC 0171]MEA5574054.1 hypothetical protein [Calothrix sp. UHCC 0171]